MPDQNGQQHFKFRRPATYEIQVEGEAGTYLSDLFGQMQITILKNKGQPPITTLVGRIRDQAELSGLLNTLYDMHLSITSVNLIEE